LNPALHLRQVWTIARLQLRRVFFSKRSFWVYLLALFPAVIFLGHGIEVKIRRDRWASRVTSPALLESIREGDTDEEVLARAGPPIDDFTRNRRGGQRARRERSDEDNEPVRRHMMYFDGRRRWELNFEAGILHNKHSRSIIDFEEDRSVFAAVFQHFYLRLAIFFGCLGIFMNLFRGEMLDKTLHFWFLSPARREVLLAGKYLAGLIASVLIFGVSAALCFGIMLWPQEPAAVDAFWRAQGASHLFWYAASAALGCVGYGSVFLAAGLLLRNPIIPAVTILLWESVNGILPSMLQKVSVLYYVQSLCPVPAPMDSQAPLLIRLLSAPAEPPSTAAAVLGLFGVTALVLWAASRAVRRLEINYGVE
jgi:ABC-type transport system involved in multi-copper enzyme maturation permease subunit